ncbi:uncharacterized protein EV154DRAFT_534402, partial [Mucor mucedo]|uniref:uncharacterized protein n=1 Tax=Mucor mucedo TaxID=29922 RepID=UPI0022211EA7
MFRSALSQKHLPAFFWGLTPRSETYATLLPFPVWSLGRLLFTAVCYSKTKQSRASRRGLTMRVLKASPAVLNCSIAPDNSTGVVPENNDVNNIPDFSDVDMVSIEHDTMNTFIEQETRQQEEEHDGYVDCEISDVDDDEGAEFEELQLAEQFTEDSSDEDNSTMEDVIE